MPINEKTLDLKRFKLIELSDQVCEQVWNEVSQWDHFQKDTLGKQLVRAVDSISANLSEAYGRYTFPDRKRFLYYARGSLCESINWINKAIARNLIEVDLGEELLSELQSISYKLNYYIRSLNKFQQKPS